MWDVRLRIWATSLTASQLAAAPIGHSSLAVLLLRACHLVVSACFLTKEEISSCLMHIRTQGRL